MGARATAISKYCSLDYRNQSHVDLGTLVKRIEPAYTSFFKGQLDDDSKHCELPNPDDHPCKIDLMVSDALEDLNDAKLPTLKAKGIKTHLDYSKHFPRQQQANNMPFAVLGNLMQSVYASLLRSAVTLNMCVYIYDYIYMCICPEVSFAR